MARLAITVAHLTHRNWDRFWRLATVGFALILLPTDVESKPWSPCDQRASSPTDPTRLAPAVVLTPQTAGAAYSACKAALKSDPKNQRLLNELVAAGIASNMPSDELLDLAGSGVSHIDEIYPDTLYQLFVYKLKDGTKPKWDWLISAAKRGHFQAAVDYWWAWYGPKKPKPEFEFKDVLDYALIVKASEQDKNLAAAVAAKKILLLSYPNGYPSQHISSIDNREIVRNTNAYPFAAFGRLEIRMAAGGIAHCSASLVGDQRTLVTAGHCTSPGATYVFQRGADLKDARPAIVFARGVFPPSAQTSSPSPDETWDDWAVLDLPSPVQQVTPLGMRDIIKNLADGSMASQNYLVAGYPADLFNTEKMIYARGCGFSTRTGSFHDAYTAVTTCPSYHGLSGAPVVISDSDGNGYVVGVVSAGWEGPLNTRTILAFSKTLFGKVCDKLNQDAAGSCLTGALR